MRWPLSQDYNEAIQCPRGNFSDGDLQGGVAVTNRLGIPQPRSGNFADVYELRCPGGRRWAVKCFTREVPGLRERYAAISRHLRQAQLPFFVDFTFLEKGIRVCGRWFPVLKMQWVEGLTLNEFVRQYANKPPMLNCLLQSWVRMAARLRQAGIAHADLQHGNILLVPGLVANALVLKLVDYDGMFVPTLAGSNTGETGHPCYQHPQRLTEQTYSLEVDRFPLLLIATTLSCLKVGGKALWDKYDSGDNLLFSESDLRSPVKSRLFYELLKLPDPQASRLVRVLLDALKGRLELVPLLEKVLPELHPPAAPKPAAAPTKRQATTAVKSAAARPVAGAQPKEKRVTPSSASPQDSKGKETYRSRRWRMSRAALLLWSVIAGLAATVLIAGAAYIYRNHTEVPAETPTFPIHESSYGPWRIKDDTLVVDPPGQNQPPHTIYFGHEDWSDYDFTVDVKRIEGESHCEFVFRHSNSGNDYCVCFGKENGLVTLEFGQNGNYTPFWKHEEKFIKNDVWYPLRAEVRGPLISISVNGNAIREWRDETHPKGSVGLRVVNASKFAFRNIKVTNLSSNEQLQGLPDLRGKE